MLTIDIVADFVCPWCFIGKRRLEVAAASLRQDLPEVLVQTRWRPFFLNPDTPPEGEPYLPFLEHKFGSRAAVEALFERVRSGGRAFGVDFAFEKIALRANTLLAHRLVSWAQQRGPADALVERLFVAQFQLGEAVGDPAVLARIAGECGYPADQWLAWSADSGDIVQLLADARGLRQLGINQVPTFIVGGQHIVVGAEDPAILVAAMRKALGK
ncbi:MAG: DsbA family oxidoreductase [Betaproteobacteria bacterium HGW-Betaproteobacteria-7]|jgi:predicted DsbA family dithiol-disulfide isomerase|nr:MAG: DsbA family oxidoreductase [Betaproteobacteria bacterium HGW-Betaproteobacteria-7]